MSNRRLNTLDGFNAWVGFYVFLALLVGLAASHGGDDYIFVESTVMKMLEEQTKIVHKCFYVGHMYTPFLEGNLSAARHGECQMLCRTKPDCSFFTFFPRSGDCRLAGNDAVYKEAEEDSMAGPRKCPVFPAGCMEMPGKGFPGDTERESALAWPSHRVPQNMECWPKNWTTNTYRQCRTFKVLESTFTGWPGKCRGMRRVLLPHLESCETFCKKKLICAAFQEVQEEKPFGPKTCWHADATAGTDCYERQGDWKFEPLSAKRFMRGNVRVLMDLRGVVVQGLVKAFSETYFLSLEDGAKACRYQCYSNLMCQYWQYNMQSGCWVEDPMRSQGHKVPYPPTTSTWLVGHQESRTVLAGEYIQHVCFDAGEPGQQVESQWELEAEDVVCPQDIRKNLGGTGGNLDACKELKIADAECGPQMYSDGWQCSCILQGEVCKPRSGTKNSLYRYKLVQTVGKVRKFVDEHEKVKEKLEEHGYKDLDRLEAGEGGKGSQVMKVTVTLAGLHYAFISSVMKVVLISHYKNCIAEVLGVPFSSIKDLSGNPGSLELNQGATPSETKVCFLVQVAQDVTPLEVHDRLTQADFVRSLKNATRKDEMPAVDYNLGVSHVTVKSKNGAAHSSSLHKLKRAVEAFKTKGSFNLNAWGILLCASLACCAIGLVMHCQPTANLHTCFQPQGAASAESTSESSEGEEDLKPGRPVELAARPDARTVPLKS